MIINLKPFLTNVCKKGLLFTNDTVYKVVSGLLYTNIFKLPLGVYIDMIVDKNYRKLSRYRLPIANRALLRCFNDLQQDYAKLARSAEYKSVSNRREEIQFLRYKIFFYSHAIKLMVDFEETEGCIKFFNDNGFTGTKEEIGEAVISELLGLKSNLDDLEALEAAEVKPAEKHEVSRSDYAKTIAVANKNGYSVSYETSVGDFINILNLQREEIARLTKK